MRATWLAAAVFVAMVVFPWAASGALVQRLRTDTGWMIKYQGDSGTDVLSVSKNGDMYVFDEVDITPSDGCQDHDPVDPNKADCSADDVETIQILLKDGDDVLTIDESASPPGPAPGVPRIMAFGGPGADTLKGGPGPETLDGDEGADPLVDGGGGDDEVMGGAGNDTVNGGDGNDRLDFNDLDSQQNQSAGSDMLDGGPGDDQLYGGPAGQQQDSDDLKGGDGTDQADYSDRTASLKIDLDGRGDDGQTGESDNVEPDVENVVGGSDDDTLTGSGVVNFLDGRDGDDRISGGAGDDVLDGGINNPGSDTLNGGDGADTLDGRAGDDSLDGGNDNDVLSGSGGTDKLEGDDGNDSLEGGAGGDALDGGAGDDIVNGAEADLIGADGSDDLSGGPGTDLLLGDDGNDTLDGGPGPDRMSGGDGRDTVDYGNRSHHVFVTLDGLPNDGEANEGDNVLPNVESVVGGTVGDDIFGDGDANKIDGSSGEDLVTGNGGADTLLGGNAPDIIRARDGAEDQVNCGDDGDLAIVDRRDVVRDCKWTDYGGRRRLVINESALVRATPAQFGLRLPDGHRFFDLDTAVKIPIASTIDPEKGVVQLATARNRAGARQEISVSQGVFSVRQEAGKQPVTELRLAGRASRRCARSAKDGVRPTDVPLRRLYTQVSKRGRYRVRGRYSTGAAVGTAWLTEDRCNGTLTHVDSGTVRVRDRVRNKNVTVHAGESYLAPAP